MAVLERSELEASPLADLHAIANEVGLEGFRRLRKAELINAILGEPVDSPPPAPTVAGDESEEPQARTRRRRSPRTRRAGSAQSASEQEDATEQEAPSAGQNGGARRPRSRVARGGSGEGSERGGEGKDSSDSATRVAEGVVELLGNGSGFLRIEPPEPSDQDVYISAAQVRRCELVSGDRVSGPVRAPRRSERYPSLVRIDTINGASAEAVSDGVRFDDLPVAWPSERLALDSGEATLEAIEWLTPLGRGSRALIVGARQVGKSETLRRLLHALGEQEGLEISLVLAGVRPEEIADWQQGPLAPAAALSFAASADSQAQALERVIDAAKRVAARGGHALVFIDTLDGLAPANARKALAAARNLREGGSLTIIATASAPFGGETTVIALEGPLPSAGSRPILDLAASGTLRAELLVGEDGAAAIAKARTEALQ